MLFIAVTVVLCGPGVKDPSQLRPHRCAAGRIAAPVISLPASFPLRNSSIQTKADCFYTASSFLWERISKKPCIAHCFPCLDGSSVEFAAGVEKGRVAAHAVDLQGKAIVEMPRFRNAGNDNTNTPVFIWRNQANGEFMTLRSCIVTVILLDIFLSLTK